MKAIDLFAGIGGFHYAAAQNNIEVVFASEIDKYAAAEYEANHGIRPHGDITKIEASDIPDHDLLMGGFPCQAFSLAGKRKGFDDTRGTLFFEIARILAYHKPRYALLENVPNIFSHDKGKTIKVILDTLQWLGYYVKTDILDSANFGVAQRRQRVFIACFLDKDEYFRFSFPKGNVAPQLCLADILEDNVPEKYFLSANGAAYVRKREPKFTAINPEQAPTLMAKYGNQSNGAYIAPYATTGKFRQGERVYKDNSLYPALQSSSSEFVAVPGDSLSLSRKLKKVAQYGERDSQGQRIYSTDGLACTLAANGGGLGAKTGLYLVGGKNGEKASARIYGEQGQFPTLTGVLQKIEQGERVRKLTPRECARLQGFPESHKIGVSDSQAYKQFGNAVTVPVVSEILKRIKSL